MTVEDPAVGQPAAVPTTDALAQEHTPVVMGLHAGTLYRVHITATDANGSTVTDSLDFETDLLPDFFSNLEVRISDAGKMQPGYTLFTVKTEMGLYTVALDAAGEVVFYRQAAVWFMVPTSSSAYLTDSGLGHPYYIANLLGQAVGTELRPEDVGTPSFHHRPAVTPEGNYLAIGVEMRTIEGYPGIDGGAITYNIIGDLFYEFEPSGALLDMFSLLDVLDPYRVLGGLFDSNFWDLDFPDAEGGTKDWSHSNSIAVDPDDGDLVISVLNQAWVVKLDRATGALVWRLGLDGDFALAPGGRWSSLHHGAESTPGGRLLLYDNAPATPPLFSRAVEYTLDTDTMVATQTWEYQGDPPALSPILGEVHRLENGNILICDQSMQIRPEEPESPRWGRITEVTYPAPSKELFSAVFSPKEGISGQKAGYSIFWAHRIPSLY